MHIAYATGKFRAACAFPEISPVERSSLLEMWNRSGLHLRPGCNLCISLYQSAAFLSLRWQPRADDWQSVQQWCVQIMTRDFSPIPLLHLHVSAHKKKIKNKVDGKSLESLLPRSSRHRFLRIYQRIQWNFNNTEICFLQMFTFWLQQYFYIMQIISATLKYIIGRTISTWILFDV